MNLKHGFNSSNVAINPDCRLMGADALSSNDMVFAERFLFGDGCSDPVRAHSLVKAIYLAGKRKYPHLWDKAHRHVHGYEYATLEKVSQLGQ